MTTKAEALNIISSQCIDFMLANGLPSFYAHHLVGESIEAKEWMLRMLELTPDNMYRVKIHTPVTKESKPRVWAFVEDVCAMRTRDGDKGTFTPIDMMFIMDGKRNKYRITRVIPPIWERVRRRDSYINLLQSEASSEFNNVNTFLIWYGDIITSKRSIVISANPLDMLSASSNASFTSCYSPSGGQFNGTISNTLSPHILIAYVESESNPCHKIGRCWVYVNEHFVIPARKYGSIFVDHSLHIRNYISSRMNGDWILVAGGLRNEYINQIGPGYIDGGSGEAIMNKVTQNIATCNRRFTVPLSMCMLCGKRHNDSAIAGCCKECVKIIKPTTHF